MRTAMSLSYLLHGTAVGGLFLLSQDMFSAPEPVLHWLGAINLWTFVAMGLDKSAARAKLPRVPERTLLGLALLGGFAGLQAGRVLFRHKTSKQSFVNAMWLVFAAQIAAVWWWISTS